MKNICFESKCKESSAKYSNWRHSPFVKVVLNDTDGTVYEKDPSALTKKVNWVETCKMSKIWVNEVRK